MSRFARWGAAPLVALLLSPATGCAPRPPRAERAETFHWVDQPITFSPPPGRWERQGENSGGMLGVRFILTGGGGQCVTVAAYRLFAERDRRKPLERLLARRDSLSRREFLDSLSLARARTDDPLSEREAETARRINDALDRAQQDYFGGSPGFVASDLENALRAASSYEPTLEELLPRIRLRPERMQEPWRWKIEYERDTTFAGRPAFASDDTLVTPERSLLYREIFWMVHGCAFKAVYQGTPQNLDTFYRMVESIQFPEEPVGVSS